MDHTTLHARLGRIDRLVADLTAASRGGFEGYAASPELQAATERRVHAALQSMVNVASMVVVGRHWERPASARDALQTLTERSVLPAELVDRLKKLVDLRDQLGHDDLALTPARVHVQLEGLVRDLEAFHRQLEGWLGDQTLDESPV